MKGTTMKKYLFGIAVAFALVGAASSAHAAPPALATRIPSARLAELKTDIAKARATDAKTFTIVNSIIQRAPEADARARGRKAATALTLAQLGPSALLPMLETLAVDAPQGLTAEQAKSVRRDVIEAVGLLRDAKALPVLGAILDDASEDVETTRTVTEAVARIGTDEAATRILTALDASTGDRSRAIVSAMGDCRRIRVTQALAGRLRSANDDATVRVASKALGRAGNAWAWKTLADRSEESRIRQTAAAALVEAFVKHDGEGRQAASNALMVVDAPETATLISDAKRGASPELVKALDALAARFARNPSR